ncbi:prolyl aminopeptidase [Rubrimonas sp.]|uniref:prolyl aminopeptidase n=1 Tax=Rubrimonas sp. TaxID=2036015 RepID=UPI002FDCA881
MLTPEGLYPPAEPYRVHRLEVAPPHELHVEECGNPEGVPALFLHGGPGGGVRPAARRTFDPRRFRVVLFDQRGCGKSTPSGELDGNTTQALIADIEAIRAHLGIERWLMTGGSWGSFLSLAYAQAHPERCLGLRLHGIFLGEAENIRFWFHGIGKLFPDAFEDFAGHVPEPERGDLLAAYHKRLIDPDPAVHLPAGLALRGFSARTQTLLPSPAHLAALTEPRAALEISRLFTHYCANGCFMPEGALLAGVDRIRHLPCEIVHGRYDVVTPMDGAWRLHRAWPEARFTIVGLANHVATPEAPALSAALTAATDRLADRIEGRGPGVEEYVALRAHHSPALSEDGERLAWISDESGLDALWSMDLGPGGAPALRAAPGERVYAAAFRPKSRDILFVTDRGGDERHQLWLLPDGATEAQALTDDPRWVHQWGCFDAAGARLAYACNARDARHMDVHVRDLATGETRAVLTGEGWRTPMRFSPDGATLLVQDNRRGMFDADLLLLDLASGRTRPVLARMKAHVAAARFIEQGAALLLVTDAARQFHGVARLPLEGGAPEWLFAPEADVEAAALSKDERLIACAVNEGGASRLVLVSRSDGATRTVTGLPEGRITTLLLAAQDTAVICAVNCFDRPSRLFRVDLATGETTVLAKGAFPLADSDVVRPETVAIGSFDGQAVPAFVFEPREPRPGRPALVIVHGGPESQYAAHWRSDVQHLVRHGWTVVAPNVRGSTGYGRAWQAGDDLEKRMDSVRDLKAVRDWLAARPGVDAARLVVYGQSYGGFMALAALTEYPDDWCAGAEFYGIADYNNLMATTGPWRRALRAVEYGDPDTPEGAAMLAALSPMRKAARIRAPLFIAHGADDPRVTPAESEMLYAALRGLGRTPVMLRIPYEGHGFARLQNRQAVFGALARFLAEAVA